MRELKSHFKKRDTRYIYLVILFIFSSIPCFASSMNVVRPSIIVSVKFHEAKAGDTLSIQVGNVFSIKNPVMSDTICYSIMGRDSLFRFKIPVDRSFGYFTLRKTRDKRFAKTNDEHPVAMLEPQFWEIGDSILIDLHYTEMAFGGTINTPSCKFYGTGSEKYNLNFKLNFRNFKISGLASSTHKPKQNRDWNGNLLDTSAYDQLFYKQLAMLDTLEHNKDRTSILAYNVLKANVLYPARGDFFDRIIRYVKKGGYALLDSKQKHLFNEKFRQVFSFTEYNTSDAGLANSESAVVLTYMKCQTGAFLEMGSSNLDNTCKYILKKYLSGEFREALLLHTLTSAKSNSGNLEGMYKTLEPYFQHKETKKIFSGLYADIRSHTFNDFELPDSNGKMIRVSSFKGKVVIVDFWFTGCGGCENYYRNVLSGIEEEFKGNPNVVFISVSVDKKRSVWQNSVKENIYTSPSAINLYTSGQQSNHPIIIKNYIRFYPTVLLLDQKGKIKYFNAEVLFNKESLKAEIKRLINTSPTF